MAQFGLVLVVVLVLLSGTINLVATIEWNAHQSTSREQFNGADDQANQLVPEKRNLFISNGWGPGGGSLRRVRLPSWVSVFNGKEPKQSNPHRSKPQATRKKVLSTRKWTIPGLFGQI